MSSTFTLLITLCTAGPSTTKILPSLYIVNCDSSFNSYIFLSFSTSTRSSFGNSFNSCETLFKSSFIPSPLTVATYLLGKTKSIKIGTAAILLPYYNPIKLAEEIAVIKTFDEDTRKQIEDIIGNTSIKSVVTKEIPFLESENGKDIKAK